MDKTEEPRIAKIQGCLLTTPNTTEIPFYGYKCHKYYAEKQKLYFTCTDCDETKKRWCESCFQKGKLKCLGIGYNIIVETKPFSSWCERMSKLELNHLKFQNSFGLNHDNIFQQAEMYFESHLHAKAIEYYHLSLRENESKDKDNSLAVCFSNLGDVYRDLGEYKKTIDYYLKSLEVRKIIYGESHSETATSYNKLALVYESSGAYQKALEENLKALEIRKSIYGEIHPETATSYHHIAATYQKLEDFEKA